MIFPDTSVWIEFFRGSDGVLADRLVRRLDRDQLALAAPVYFELLSGASGGDLARLEKLLPALPIFYPTSETWGRMEDWIRIAVSAGQRFGFGDLLIGAIAAGEGGQLWSLDSDFNRMESLGFLVCVGLEP